MRVLEEAIRRQRERRDPLGRLPWPVRAVGVLVVAALAVAQVALGQGASRLLGLLLLLVVVPPQAVGVWAAWRVQREDDTGSRG